MTVTIPTLRTDRLVLRAPAEVDFPTMLSFNDSPRNAFVGGTIPRQWVWRTMLANVGHWVWRGYGFYSVDLHDGTFVGRVGVIFHDEWPEPELAWHLYDGHEGQGYATEAAHAAKADYHARISPLPLISMIDERNAASQAVARRLGAVPGPVEDDEGDLVCIWRHTGPAA
jgi:RimJ/RimL family protein N-acetyltransferase